MGNMELPKAHPQMVMAHESRIAWVLPHFLGSFTEESPIPPVIIGYVTSGILNVDSWIFFKIN